MNETGNMVPWADWVLIEAAKQAGWYQSDGPSNNLARLREAYKDTPIYRALCDMIAKHEQPPVDPDVEAVKRIMRAWYGFAQHQPPPLCYDSESYDRAVAQYKQERAK